MTDTAASERALKNLGISVEHERMPNGELRIRLIGSDGIGYVRTEAGRQGAWQNSHLHMRTKETYIVQSGWIGLALLAKYDRLEVRILREGDIWTAPIGVAHNVYMPVGSVTHVIKHGSGGENDWVKSESTGQLDRLSKALSEADILARADRL